MVVGIVSVRTTVFTHVCLFFGAKSSGKSTIIIIFIGKKKMSLFRKVVHQLRSLVCG